MLKRHVLWCMLIFMFITHTFVVMNMSMAIVSMVNKRNTSSAESTSDQPARGVTCPKTSFILTEFFDAKNSSKSSSPPREMERFDWSEAEQNMILSGPFRLSYLVIFAGGILSHKYGSKKVVGLSQFSTLILCSLIPFMASYGPEAVAWVRCVQGLLSTLAAPSGVFSIIGNWSPPQERAKFGATFMVGIALGETLGSFIFGYVAEYIHWKYVFHLTTVCGIIWSVFWYMLVYDSPAQHPTISAAEREFIESSLKQTSPKSKGSIPWKNIMTSVPFMLCVLAVNAGMWAFLMMNTYTPLYLKTIYGMNSNEIGIISSVPYFTMLISAFGVAYYGDSFVKNEKLSITQVRKICNFVGSVVAALPLILIAFTKCNLTMVIVYVLLTRILGVFGNFGAPLGVLDLSPNFCGVMEGILGTISAVVMFLITIAVNFLSGIWDIESVWKALFLFTGLYCMLTNSIYIIFGTSEVQPWNFKKGDLENTTVSQKEMKTLLKS